MRNKLGLCEWIFSVNGPFAIQIASEIGFEGIQVGDLGGEEKRFPMNNKRVQQGYMEAAERFGVELQSLHLYTLVRQGTMLYPRHSPNGERALQSIIKGIEACRAMGIGRLMLSAFFATEIKDEESFQNYAQILREACSIAADGNIRIIFESVLNVKDMQRMRDIVGKEMKFCYDIGNPVRWNSGEPKHEIDMLGIEAIDHIHLKDIPADKVGYCLLGEGCAGVNGTLDYLHQKGYRGWYITENNYENDAMGKQTDFIKLAKSDFQFMQEKIRGIHTD